MHRFDPLLERLLLVCGRLSCGSEKLIEQLRSLAGRCRRQDVAQWSAPFGEAFAQGADQTAGQLRESPISRLTTPFTQREGELILHTSVVFGSHCAQLVTNRRTLVELF